MVIETATVWATSALVLIVIIGIFYFAIFFFIWYVVLWGIAEVFRSIRKILYND